MHSYPAAFAGLRDVALRSPGARLDRQRDSVMSASEAAARSTDLQRLIVVSRPSDDRAVEGSALAAFREIGFHPEQTIRGPWSTVTVLGRTG